MIRVKKLLRYVYHKSNPYYREFILKNGLKVNIGVGQLGIPTDITTKAIYATNSDNPDDLYDTTYDDDVFEIDTSKINNIWYEDTNVYGKHKHIVTFEDIPKEAIHLVYEGIGESII